MLIQTNILSSYIILSMLIFRHCYYDNNCKYNNRYYNNSHAIIIVPTLVYFALVSYVFLSRLEKYVYMK